MLGVRALAILMMSLAVPAAAQPPPDTAIALTGGVGWRGDGRVSECCGPLQSDREQTRSWWLGGSVSRDLTGRLALDAEVTWSRGPRYIAYVQGNFNNLSTRVYQADNRTDAWTAAGLVRWHLWRAPAGAAALVAGGGWLHERRESRLRSVVVRPPPIPVPQVQIDLADTRNAALLVTGLDGEAVGTLFTLVASARVHWHPQRDASRSDLDLAPLVVRIGVGVRTRF